MQNISIDIETYSSRDLLRCGVYKYSESTDFEILLFGYSVDSGAVHVVDLAEGEKIPSNILAALTDPAVIKWAWNANFERVCLSRYLYPNKGRFINPKSWRCTMVWSASLGLPLSLEKAGEVLKLKKQKLEDGKRLIRKFTRPPRQKAQMSLLEDDSDWQKFIEYNRRDVEVELEAKALFEKYPMSEYEWELFELDQSINDRGVLLDMPLVKNAIQADTESKAELKEKMHKLTNLENPNSVTQIKQWLCDNGLEMDSLTQKAVAEAVDTENAPPEVVDVLTLRMSLAKSSVSKYKAMDVYVCDDGRVRGLFQFYGARTGRWTGRGVQGQNLPATFMSVANLGHARSFIKNGDFDTVDMIYGDVQSALSQLIRTAFIPSHGKKFIVADFSAIEARVLAWMANEEWRNEVFSTHGKIYEASASQMFNIPMESITKELRQKGKVAELALGYGGSVGALKSMGALEKGLTEGELQPLVDTWRKANPQITAFWNAVERMAIKAVKNFTDTSTHGLIFTREKNTLFITLPSGRVLAYQQVRIGDGKFGECIKYNGVSNKKWVSIETYGAKLVENIVQAVSRDLLAFAMAKHGSKTVMHVHDEIVLETTNQQSLANVCKAMSILPPWAEGLIMKADGFETTTFYRKD
jgi:DNA polymerase